MTPPKVSVLVPAYDAHPFLPRCLASIQSQSMDDFEVVVVDDGSTRGYDELLEELDDPRFRICRLDRNRGRGAARNAALDAARGEWIAWQDGDDWSYPDRLAKQLAYLETHPEARACFCALVSVDDEGRVLGFRPWTASAPRRLSETAPPPLNSGAGMLHRSTFASLRFDEALTVSEDYDFYLRALRRTSFGGIEDAVYTYYELPSLDVGKYWNSCLVCNRVRRRLHGPWSPRAIGGQAMHLAKFLIHVLLMSLGAHGLILRKRLSPIAAQHRARHEAARRLVHARWEARFSPATRGFAP